MAPMATRFSTGLLDAPLVARVGPLLDGYGGGVRAILRRFGS